MRIHFVAPSGLEPWDHSRPEGIAGSETCVIELSRRLAKRGHDVRVYNYGFPDTTDDPLSGVKWFNLATTRINPNEDGCWWLCRCPALIDGFGDKRRPNQRIFLRCDDMHYGLGDAGLNRKRYERFDHILTMSQPHLDVFRMVYPYVEPGKCSTLGCGIASERIADLESRERPERDPYRLIWVSSPDRGLDTMIRIFHKARETEPRLNLHVYYGWDGCERASGGNPDDPRMALKRLCTEGLPQDGITWHGRVGKEELWRGHMQANLWTYPTLFSEAGVVSAMEAQACGAIPVTSHNYGLAEKVQNGVAIPGDPNDPVVFDRFVKAILRLVKDAALCSSIREVMMPWARAFFDWEKVVDHHEMLAGCAQPSLLYWDIRRDEQTIEPFYL